MKSTGKFFPLNNRVLASQFVLNQVGVNTMERPGPPGWETSTQERAIRTAYLIAIRTLYSTGTVLELNGIGTIVNGYWAMEQSLLGV